MNNRETLIEPQHSGTTERQPDVTESRFLPLYRETQIYIAVDIVKQYVFSEKKISL